MNKNTKEPRIQLRCSVSYKSHYDKYVEKSGVSGAKIVRQALDEFMEKYPDGAMFLQSEKSQDQIKKEVEDMKNKLNLLLSQMNNQ